jgi:hypothetical protein
MITALLASSILSIAAETPSWQTEWEKTIKAAETEGALTIYSSITPKIILDTGVFQKRFPGIKITSVTSEGGGLFQRITTERRAEKYLADIVIGGASTPWNLHLAKVLDPIRPLLILPEVIDESGWWEGRHAYVDWNVSTFSCTWGTRKRAIFPITRHSSTQKISGPSGILSPRL